MHVTHYIVVNAENHQQACNRVDTYLCDTDRDGWDYFDIEASLDVDKDEYVWFGKDSPDTSGGFLTTVASINKEMAKEVSRERYNRLKKEALEDMIAEKWYWLSTNAKKLYGIADAVGKKIDITDKDVQGVNAWDFCEFGITPLDHEKEPELGMKRFLVQVDFHF